MNTSALDFSISSFEEIKKTLSDNKKNSETNTAQNNKFLPRLIKGEPKTTYKVRFLPNVYEKKAPPWVQANVHIFTNGDNKVIYEFCPSTYNAQDYKCPICEFSKYLFKKGDKLSEDLARMHWIKKRWFANVYVKEDPRKGEENQTGKVLIWEFGSKIFDKLTEAITTHSLFFWHPTDGFDFNVIVKQVSGYQNYDLSDFSRKSSPLANSQQEIETILNNSYNLREVILGRKRKTYEELTMLLGRNISTATQQDSTTNVDPNSNIKEVITNVTESITQPSEKKNDVRDNKNKKDNAPSKITKDDDIDIDSINFDETPF